MAILGIVLNLNLTLLVLFGDGTNTRSTPVRTTIRTMIRL
jgi:hypothetical protein